MSRLFFLSFGLHIAAAATPFETPVTPAIVDPAAFSEWCDGSEKPIGIKEGPAKVLWTTESGSDWGGVPYGEQKTPGTRHLRLGFQKPVAVGSVLVSGGGALGVLKADATYPGDLGDDSQWLEAERIHSNKITRGEVSGGEYAVWTLPPGTTTRALRFTHRAAPSDPAYEGRLGGVLVLADRMTNIAPAAIAVASARNEVAGKVNNTTNDRTWQAWNNGENGATDTVSPERPEWLMLVWPGDVPLGGIAACWAGFAEAEVQVYTGPTGRHPREANEDEWRAVASNSKAATGYPRELAPNWFAFPKPVETRALRLRITRPSQEGHDHLRDKIKDGRGVWLGELLAMRPLGDEPLSSALIEQPADASHPPIAINFTLPEAGTVTLVIEDEAGKRVRNLIADVPFPAGKNTAWWDGTDDLGRDPNAARHGLYQIPRAFVVPGRYTVRGLWRKAVDLRYEFSIYNAGNPPWQTVDKTGGWMTNHTPPTSALFVPAGKSPDREPRIYLGAYVSEGGHGLQWVKPDGTKIGGQGWVGGNWTGAPTLALDRGSNPVDGDVCYVANVWEGELRITAKTAGEDRPVFKELLGDDRPKTKPPVLEGFDGGDHVHVLAALAVQDGILVAAMVRQNELLFIDAREGKILRREKIDSPRGIAFDGHGHLLVLSGKTLRRHTLHGLPKVPTPDEGEVLIATGLEDPHGIALDANGQIYISDHGDSHQVKVFTADGHPTGTIGKPGPPAAGPYDELHMNHPNGLTVDGSGNLWVTENDFQPKRVSVWSPGGELLKAFYGPGEYGGGGTLDPLDKNRFYYRGMEFALDWESGENRLESVLFRSTTHDTGATPEQPIHGQDGRRYFTNCHSSNPTGGAPVATLWIERDGVAVRCGAAGRAREWPDLPGEAPGDPAVFVWCDLNDDATPQTDEITIRKGNSGGVVIQPDLSISFSRLDDDAIRLAPTRLTTGGAPVYDLDAAEKLFEGAQPPTTSGGDQVLTDPSGWQVSTVAMKPFAPESLGGAFKGEPKWSYPNPWPGLHASHEAPVPDRPGQIIGTTRLLGGLVTPRGGSDAGPLFCVNGNMGNAYLFTVDGLFVAELFKDVRVGRSWSMPRAERGMELDGISLHDENFWPSITQTEDGKIYLVDGARTSLVRVDGLDSIRRIAPSPIEVSADDLTRASAWTVAREAARRAEQGGESLRIPILAKPPEIDGKLDDWSGADWSDIDKRGTAANFDSNSRPYDVTAALSIAGGRLHAAFRTGDKDLLRNSGETPQALFKNGGCLDLMIGANPAAGPKRTSPVTGDARLLVTLVDGKPRAMLYRPVVPGTRKPVAFSSPWRTVTIDQVVDVTADLAFARDDAGNYEFSIPLAIVGLTETEPGQTLTGDLGILRGNGFQTLQRAYWSNKATAIVSDVPSEVQLEPSLWGKWEITR